MTGPTPEKADVASEKKAGASPAKPKRDIRLLNCCHTTPIVKELDPNFAREGKRCKLKNVRAARFLITCPRCGKKSFGKRGPDAVVSWNQRVAKDYALGNFLPAPEPPEIEQKRLEEMRDKYRNKHAARNKGFRLWGWLRKFFTRRRNAC